MVSRRYVARRNRHAAPILEVGPGNRQDWWKRSTFKWDGRKLSLDKTVGSRELWPTQGSSGQPASDLGGDRPRRRLRSRYRLGHRPVVLVLSPHGYGSMSSQANVGAGKWLRPPSPSVAFRDRGHCKGVAGSGWAHEASGPEASSAWWVERLAPACASKAGRWELARSTKYSSVKFGEKCSYAHRQVDGQPTVRPGKKDDKSAVAMLKKKDWHENVWRPDINRDTVMSWNEDLLDVDHQAHDIWVASSKTWSHWSCFFGRAQTCRNQTNVWNSPKLIHVTLKFESKSFARIFMPTWTFVRYNRQWWSGGNVWKRMFFFNNGTMVKNHISSL